MIASAVHSDRFHILRELGGGGMGVVYEAEDAATRALVALKALRRADGEALYRFKREFRLLATLEHHPNLVRLGELFCERGQWFFTMELIHGATLLEHVRAPDGASLPFDEPRLRAAFRQLAEGLRALHAAGHVHCDIKPSNVLVSDDGRVVLLDFGLATAAEQDPGDVEAAPPLLGTVPYMAPEQQLRRDPIGPAVDAYAVGVMLFEALTGQLPFAGPPLQIMRQKQLAAAPAPHSLVAAIPPDLDLLCQELMSREPEARPTAEGLLARIGGELQPSLEVVDEDSDGARMFVGRADELGTLGAAVRAVEGGGTAGVLVEGEPGVGKTALVERFLRDLRAADPTAVILAGRCYEQEFVPFKAFDGVVDALSHYLMLLRPVEAAALLPPSIHFAAVLFPVLRRVPVIAQSVPLRRGVDNPSGLRARAFEELKRLLAALAERAPLVIFIDDLQWSDADSLDLLNHLLRAPDAPRSLMIATSHPGAGGGQPVINWQQSFFRQIDLDGLSPGESAQLVAALSPHALSSSAAQTLIADSGGHPLFLSELARATDESRAHLDELLGRRIASLAPEDQRILEAAAVAGVPMRNAVLAEAADLAVGELQPRLDVLRREQLVRSVRVGDERLTGLFHDRVREAVLARLDGDGAALHLAIGRSLWGAAFEDPVDESLFAVVHHLHRGAALIELAEERARVAALSLRAAQKAKLATAYAAAFGYLDEAERLLAGQDAAEQRFAVQRERIEIEYLAGNSDAALARFEAALAQARGDQQHADLFALVIHLHTIRGRFADALAMARRGLRGFGVVLPERVGRLSILRELGILRYRQGRRSLAELADLKRSPDERAHQVTRLLTVMAQAAYFCDRALFALVQLTIARFSLACGATPDSAHGFVGYGMTLAGSFGRYRKAFELGQIAIRLDERFGVGEWEARVRYLAGNFLIPWVRPLAEALPHVRRAAVAGLRLGDTAFWTYAATSIGSLLEMQAASVSEVLSAANAALEVARRCQNRDWTAYNQLRINMYRCLHESRTDSMSLASDNCSEDELRESLDDEQTPLALCAFFGYKAQLCYLFGEPEEAWRQAMEEVKRESVLFAQVALAHRIFYRVLIAAQLLRGRSSVNRRHLKRAVARGLKRLRGWAELCPENFGARYQLARAEAAHVADAAAYQAAIAAAQKSGASGLEALALELAARRAREERRTADADLGPAIAAYERWGAHAKAEQLQSLFGEPRSPGH
jgi:predicted ATPase